MCTILFSSFVGKLAHDVFISSISWITITVTGTLANFFDASALDSFFDANAFEIVGDASALGTFFDASALDTFIDANAGVTFFCTISHVFHNGFGIFGGHAFFIVFFGHSDVRVSVGKD
jgi:hypothetical protein